VRRTECVGVCLCLHRWREETGMTSTKICWSSKQIRVEAERMRPVQNDATSPRDGKNTCGVLFCCQVRGLEETALPSLLAELDAECCCLEEMRIWRGQILDRKEGHSLARAPCSALALSLINQTNPSFQAWAQLWHKRPTVSDSSQAIRTQLGRDRISPQFHNIFLRPNTYSPGLNPRRFATVSLTEILTI